MLSTSTWANAVPPLLPSFCFFSDRNNLLITCHFLHTFLSTLVVEYSHVIAKEVSEHFCFAVKILRLTPVCADVCDACIAEFPAWCEL